MGIGMLKTAGTSAIRWAARSGSEKSQSMYLAAASETWLRRFMDSVEPIPSSKICTGTSLVSEGSGAQSHSLSLPAAWPKKSST